MTEPAPPTSGPPGGWPHAIALSVLVLVVFGRLVFADFVDWDDPHTIRDNPAFNPPQWWLVMQSWGSFHASLYAPLTYTIWGVLADLSHATRGGRLEPVFFHGANVLMHLAATLVVWSILRRLIDSRWPALLGAAVFALHPVQVEPVAWASGLKDVLCALFVFLAIDQLLRGRCWTGAACMVLACLAKPTGIVAAPMAAVVVYCTCYIKERHPERYSAKDLTSTSKPDPSPSTAQDDEGWWRTHLPLCLWLMIAIVFAIIARIAQPPLREHAALHYRPLVAADAMTFYLSKLIWPAGLTIDYARTPQYVIESGLIWHGWFAPLALAIGAIALRRRFPMLLASVAIALIGVAPVLGIVPFAFQAYSTVADHYLYPSMLGAALLIAAVLKALDGRAARLAAGTVVALLAVISFRTTGYWKNDDALFARVQAVSPRSMLPFTNWPTSLAQRGLDEQAIEKWRAVLRTNPDLVYAHMNIASVLLKRGDRAGASGHFRDVLRIYATQPNPDPAAIEHLRALIADIESKSSNMPP